MSIVDRGVVESARAEDGHKMSVGGQVRTIIESVGRRLRQEWWEIAHGWQQRNYARLVERRLVTVAQAKRARWSAHRAEYYAHYIVGSLLVIVGLISEQVISLSEEVWKLVLLLLMFSSALMITIRAFDPRFSANRIHLQISQIISALNTVEHIAAGESARRRTGNPARDDQFRIRRLRALLRRAAMTIPRQLQSASGRGHQQGDSVLSEKLKTCLLQSVAAAPVLADSASREFLWQLLARLSVAVHESDPSVALLPDLRSVPTSPSAAITPLETWSWRWHKLTTTVVLSIIALPVLAFVISKFADSPTTAGLMVAGTGTAAHSLVRYLEYRNAR